MVNYFLYKIVIEVVFFFYFLVDGFLRKSYVKILIDFG